MCSDADAIANKLGMVFLQTTPSSGTSKSSQSLFWTQKLLLQKQSKVKSSEVGETRDYRFREWCTVHGVCAVPCVWGLRGTISLLLSIAKHTTRIEMFEKVASFTKEDQLSHKHYVSVCADGALGMIRIKKALWIYEKGKQKYVRPYCLLRWEKIRQRRNLRRIDSF